MKHKKLGGMWFQQRQRLVFLFLRLQPLWLTTMVIVGKLCRRTYCKPSVITSVLTLISELIKRELSIPIGSITGKILAKALS